MYNVKRHSFQTSMRLCKVENMTGTRPNEGPVGSNTADFRKGKLEILLQQ